VTLGEDQQHDPANDLEALDQRRSIGHGERDARQADLRLCSSDASRHRRLGHEQRLGDLGDRQSADRPQREGDLRLGVECRMATAEQQCELVVDETGRSAGDRDRCVTQLGQPFVE
jgi:hypothetical protein